MGIVGCGGIVKLAHLPAYTAYGVDVVGVFDADPEATDGIQTQFPVVGKVFASVDELLADPRIDVVDIATHPGVRRGLIEQAIDAGRHVLSQKPFAVDLAAARALVEHADRSGVRLAVNQNGRWAPPWRIATLLIEQGKVGEVCAVTHLFEHDFDWTIGTPYDEIEHFVLYDFAVHWIDITRCWLADKAVATVSAREYRTPSQAPGQKAPWGALVVVDCTDGTSAVIRSVGVATRRPGNPFWVHGTEGTIRGAFASRQISSSSSATGRACATRSKGVAAGRLRRDDGRAVQRDRRGPRAVQLRSPQPADAGDDARGLPIGGRGSRPVALAEVA